MVAYMHTNVQMNHIQNSSFNRDVWGSRITAKFIPIINQYFCVWTFV